MSLSRLKTKKPLLLTRAGLGLGNVEKRARKHGLAARSRGARVALAAVARRLASIEAAGGGRGGGRDGAAGAGGVDGASKDGRDRDKQEHARRAGRGPGADARGDGRRHLGEKGDEEGLAGRERKGRRRTKDWQSGRVTTKKAATSRARAENARAVGEGGEKCIRVCVYRLE